MAITTWHAVGVVNVEPVLKKLSGGKVMARTILAIEPERVGEPMVYLPVHAFNKKAHVLCAQAHRGSTIYCKGTFRSNLQTTSQQGKTLIGILFKIIDFTILIKEPVAVEEKDFIETVRLYEPEAFMEEEDEEDVE